ncbi:hypothetical protein B0A48_13648 [Cryoendolithus antarcticus]|uniref:MAGE domain-containing protein n=1 Tax=Cryoendolithus antarcticus TaxID=1507870 RepID=A0A1V8SPC7_9PEZI|nr:hypothetical protein B0A48_13648 [Cryoendolithus antarcticus]
MPQIHRKRRAEPSPSLSASPEPATQRRRQSASPDFDAIQNGTESDQTLETSVKKLVRLALSSEYQRRPLRRADIGEKVIGPQGGRQFKKVFERAQEELRGVFGMELVELPVREKVTVQQRRAAAKATDKASKAPASYILTSTLPAAFTAPSILPPSSHPIPGFEPTYTALYTLVISLILLSRGQLADTRLERYFKRLNLSTTTPLPDTTTPVLLKRMEKDGYINRIREQGPGGEENVSWTVGPRGRLEVGDRGVGGLVRGVFGGVDEEDDELERRIARSLGIGEREEVAATQRDKQSQAQGQKKKRGRPRRGDEARGEEEEEEGTEED